MKRNYCWTIAVFTLICCVVFFVRQRSEPLPANLSFVV